MPNKNYYLDQKLLKRWLTYILSETENSTLMTEYIEPTPPPLPFPFLGLLNKLSKICAIYTKCLYIYDIT